MGIFNLTNLLLAFEVDLDKELEGWENFYQDYLQN